ncbi:MAG: sulfite exporter TauE/SafE family protein [Hyphomicrobiaceae bacterium]|nr:sulfite exporter TauE/SafE family protein [Hyphomicrobiaceae bacterium]
MDTWSPAFVVLVTATFLLGGFVKGFVGFGPPLVAVTILAPIYGIRTVLALIVFPTIVLNLLQALQGGHGQGIVRRLWPYMITISAGIWFGVGILTRAEVHVLTVLLGVMLFTYAVASLCNVSLPQPGRAEIFTTPAMGAVSGLLAGMTGVYVFPTALYLRALGYDRDALIQAMGIVFLCVSAAIAVSLGGRNLLPGDLALASALVTLPALVGQWAGQRAARTLPDAQFRRVFLTALAIVGVGIVVRSLIA